MTFRGILFRFIPLVLAGCSSAGSLAWNALDQASRYSARRIPVAEIAVPDGYRAIRVAAGFNFPSALTFDDQGRFYVLESHTIPVPFLRTKIVQVDREGNYRRVELRGPAVPKGNTAIGLTFHKGWLYFTHEEGDGSYGIFRVRPDGGEVELVLGGIPTQGDHDVNHLAFDRNDALYFGVGSATNSGVVSSGDPVNQEWLKKHPGAADVACDDLVLTGQKFQDDNTLTPQKGDTATTGAYQPYGQSAAQRVAAKGLCTSAVYRLSAGASQPELVAWGFRNPVAITTGNRGDIWIGMHGADIRGTRPILDDPDAVLRLETGAWYGWPDYSAALLPFTDTRYLPPREFMPADHTGLDPLIDLAGSGLRPPDRSLLVAATKPHAALSGLAFVADGPLAGRLLLAEMGDFKPMTDKAKPDEHAGFQVEILDPANGSLAEFARNRGTGDATPASTLDLRNGFERPVDVRIGPDGKIYVLDYGVLDTTGPKPRVMPKTGKVFVIEPE